MWGPRQIGVTPDSMNGPLVVNTLAKQVPPPALPFWSPASLNLAPIPHLQSSRLDGILMKYILMIFVPECLYVGVAWMCSMRHCPRQTGATIRPSVLEPCLTISLSLSHTHTHTHTPSHTHTHSH